MAQRMLILGGARSGKSAFAENFVNVSQKQQKNARKLYIATAQALDEEMGIRIETHRQRRDHGWLNIESPLELVSAITTHCDGGAFVLVDSLTLWISNLMLAEYPVCMKFDQLYRAVETARGTLVMVGDEVGHGIVPDNKMAREFRDYAGLLHQKIAKMCDFVYFVTAGIPTKLK